MMLWILSSGCRTRDLHMHWSGLTLSGMWSSKEGPYQDRPPLCPFRL